MPLLPSFLLTQVYHIKIPMSNTVCGADMGIFVLYVGCEATLLYSVTLW
jgi:hypothetical protein